MACIGVLVLEMAIFHFSSRQRTGMWDRLNLDVPALKVGLSDVGLNWRRQRPLLACFALLVLTTTFLVQLDESVETPPSRVSFTDFPLFYRGWIGQESGIDTEVLNTLWVTDYIKAD